MARSGRVRIHCLTLRLRAQRETRLRWRLDLERAAGSSAGLEAVSRETWGALNCANRLASARLPDPRTSGIQPACSSHRQLSSWIEVTHPVPYCSIDRRLKIVPVPSSPLRRGLAAMTGTRLRCPGKTKAEGARVLVTPLFHVKLGPKTSEAVGSPDILRETATHSCSVRPRRR